MFFKKYNIFAFSYANYAESCMVDNLENEF